MANEDSYMIPEDDESYDDDASYDNDLEEDRGDEDDIADEMEALEARRLEEEEQRKFDEYEILADNAAAQKSQEVDMEEPTNPSTRNTVLQKTKCSRKGRCATKGIRPTGPMHLEFDALGRPRGKWRRKYGQQLGFCMRKFNINWNWKDVSVGKRKLMWEDTMNLFHIPDDTKLRKKFLAGVAKRFRDFKAKLVSGWITKTRRRTIEEDGKEPPDIWSHIKVEDWKLFQQIKTSSPAKRKREKATESAKKNNHYHHMGQYDFNTARAIWIKDNFYPTSASTGVTTGGTESGTGDASSAVTATIEVNRADDWYCAMHVKDKQTGKYVIRNPKTKEVADEVRELRKKEAEGKFVAEREKDCLFYALGEKPDHPGRAKGFGGVNISVREAFGVQTTKLGGSSEISLAEREAIKNELREEFRDVLKSELKGDLLSVLQQLGFKLPNEIQSQQVICADRAEGNQLESSLPPIVKNDTPCRLFLSDPHSGVSYEVARGKTFPVEEGQEGSFVLDHVRVKVSIVHEEFQGLPLPVPVQVYDLHVLSDAVGSFVQWPIAFVRLEEEDDQNVRRRGHEVLGSNSHQSRLSTTPTRKPAKELMVESLSPDCQWLNSLIGTMADEESFDVYFEADLFYFKEDGKTEVYKNDLKEFLKRSELSISIIQIFIRAIQDDLIKADTRPRLGWLCPDATSDAKLIKNAENAIAYVTSAFQKADINDDKFILAPIFDSKHWLLLVISPQTYTIYEFDSIRRKEGRKLYMKMVVLSALKRYKMSGGKLENSRREPLWKSMKCPQQNEEVECGLFVLRFMYDIVKSCTAVEDLEKVWSSTKEDIVYNECEINEIRDKWASYFTSSCIT